MSRPVAPVVPVESGMTLVDLAVAVEFNTLSSNRYRSFVKRWLNDAVVDVCRRLDLIDGFDRYSVGSGGYVLDDSNEPARFLTVSSVWSATLTTADRPADFMLTSLEGGLVGVTLTGSPLPPFAGVGGQRAPAAMVNDTDVSGLGGELDEALIAFCRARAFRREDDFDLAGQWDLEYITRLRSASPGHIPNPALEDEVEPNPYL